PTSSTPSPLPRSTACSSPTAAGAANGTNNGFRRSSSTSSCPQRQGGKAMQRSYGSPVISQRVPGGVAHKMPADLRTALIANATALAAWNALTPLARNEFICWVLDAKQHPTRARRIRRTQEELEEGQRRPCCWTGCKHRERNGK